MGTLWPSSLEVSVSFLIFIKNRKIPEIFRQHFRGIAVILLAVLGGRNNPIGLFNHAIVSQPLGSKLLGTSGNGGNGFRHNKGAISGVRHSR